MGWFKNVILVGSSLDSYAPIDSAWILISEKATNESDKGKQYIEMGKNLINWIKANKVIRNDVIFNIK